MPIIFEPIVDETGYGQMGLPLRVRGAESNAFGLMRLPLNVRATGISDENGSGAVHLPLRVRGIDTAALPPDAGSNGFGYAVVPMPALEVWSAASSDLVPNIGIGSMSLPLSIACYASSGGPGTGHMSLGLRVFGSDAAALGRMTLPLRVYAYEEAPSRFATLYQLPTVQAYGWDGVAKTLFDAVTLDAEPAIVRRIQQLISGLGFADNAATTMELLLRLDSRVGLGDAIDAMLRMRLQDALSVGDQLTAAEYALLALVDSMALAAGPGATQETSRVVAALLALSDTLDHPTREQLIAAIGVGSLLQADVIAYARALDALRIAAALSGDLLLTAVLRDEVGIAGSTITVAELLQTLRSSFGATATLSLGDEAYTAWVLNPSTKAVWSYDNYPFNSFAKLGDKYLAAAPDGIYEITGDKDGDAEVQWRARTGLLNFGTQLKHRVDTAYLGYTGEGSVGLSVITTSPEGEKIQYNYKMKPMTAGAPRENRIKLGKGLKSVYFAFELVGTGAFELHNLQILPMTLERRV